MYVASTRHYKKHCGEACAGLMSACEACAGLMSACEACAGLMSVCEACAGLCGPCCLACAGLMSACGACVASATASSIQANRLKSIKWDCWCCTWCADVSV